MNYVLGFAFTPDGSVALIRKIKPEWQAGKLNGVGGKIEDWDPSDVHAMTREFQEETGVFLEPHLWREVGVVNFGGHRPDEPPGYVKVFTVVDPMVQFVCTTTKEAVSLHDAWWCHDNPSELLPNVMTLIHASLIRPNEHGKRPYVGLSYR
jgi:8-oxo-dGTP pyrophosphatase MutT (NUDIX family)